MAFEIPRAVYSQMCDHAVKTFPDECCGLLVDRGDRLEVVRVTNIQNEKHAQAPEQFPRTAETAYTMGPEAAPVLVAHEKGDLVLRALYHSHPQHDAYFSDEDRKQATVWDEPSYPDAAQVVISVYDRRVKKAKAFQWSAAAGDFVEVELDVLDSGDPAENPS